MTRKCVVCLQIIHVLSPHSVIVKCLVSIVDSLAYMYIEIILTAYGAFMCYFEWQLVFINGHVFEGTSSCRIIYEM